MQEVENESIAVLAFVNMSSDPEQEYFSDGIAEELLNLLAKIPELRVAARTSAFSYKAGNWAWRTYWKDQYARPAIRSELLRS